MAIRQHLDNDEEMDGELGYGSKVRIIMKPPLALAFSNPLSLDYRSPVDVVPSVDVVPLHHEAEVAVARVLTVADG